MLLIEMLLQMEERRDVTSIEKAEEPTFGSTSFAQQHGFNPKMEVTSSLLQQNIQDKLIERLLVHTSSNDGTKVVYFF